MPTEVAFYRKKYIATTGRYSSSQVMTFNNCPRKYYYSYREGLITPPGCGLLLGKSCHETFQKNYRQKVDKKEDLPLDTLMDIYKQAFETNVKSWEIINWQESVRAGRTWEMVDRKPEDVLDEGYRIIKLYREKISPNVQPMAVEKRIELTLGGVKYIGYLDLVKQNNHIIDHKICKKFPTTDNIRDSLQLTSYAVAWSLISGTPIDKIPVALDYFLRAKNEAEYRSHITIRDPKQVEELKDIIEALHLRIQRVESGDPWELMFNRRTGDWVCLSMDTEILSDKGWVTYKDYKEGSKLLTCNQITHKLEWESPNIVFKKKYKGKMIEYNGDCVRFNLTADHNCYLSCAGLPRYQHPYKFLKANEIRQNNDYYFLIAGTMNETYSEINLSDELIALSGWITAEGYIGPDGKSRGIIEIAQYKKKGRDKIRTLLKKAKLSFTEDQKRFRLHTEDSMKIRKIHGDKSKIIPTWVKYLSERQFNIWFEAFMDGDGHRQSETLYRVAQKEESIIDELQVVLIMRGYSAVKGGMRISSTGGRYYPLSICKNRTEGKINIKKHLLKKYDVNTDVWCASVPNATIVTRYKGRVVILGNCSPKWCGFFSFCRGTPPQIKIVREIESGRESEEKETEVATEE